MNEMVGCLGDGRRNSYRFQRALQSAHDKYTFNVADDSNRTRYTHSASMICYAVFHSIQQHLTGCREIRHSETEKKKQTEKNCRKMQTHECEIVFYLSIHNSSYKRLDIQFTVSFIYFWWVKVKKKNRICMPEKFLFQWNVMNATRTNSMFPNAIFSFIPFVRRRIENNMFICISIGLNSTNLYFIPAAIFVVVLFRKY